jgi:hypothetical protein
MEPEHDISMIGVATGRSQAPTDAETASSRILHEKPMYMGYRTNGRRMRRSPGRSPFHRLMPAAPGYFADTRIFDATLIFWRYMDI